MFGRRERKRKERLALIELEFKYAMEDILNRDFKSKWFDSEDIEYIETIPWKDVKLFEDVPNISFQREAPTKNSLYERY